jgi:hypothetical protein
MTRVHAATERTALIVALALVALLASGSIAFVLSRRAPATTRTAAAHTSLDPTSVYPNFPTRAARPPAVGGCIDVTDAGQVTDARDCAAGAPYQIVSARPESVDGVCPGHKADSWTDLQGYRLCVRPNLVRPDCYVFPPAWKTGGTGWIQASATCPAGTVQIVSIVPGATARSACPARPAWNHWYAFDDPLEIACVQER